MSRPPIATPDGKLTPAVPAWDFGGLGWKGAPPIVRSAHAWHLLMAWLTSAILVIIAAGNIMEASTVSTEAMLFFLFFAAGGIIPLFHAWLSRSHKQALPLAWKVQFVVSVLGIFIFPLGTIVHGNILLQWFRPEVRAWYTPPALRHTSAFWSGPHSQHESAISRD